VSSPSRDAHAEGVTEAAPARVDRRRERSAQTRRRIADAAYRMFVERGFAVPIGDIAAEAGVSVQTVYVTYRTKVALAQAALERAVLADAAPLPPHRQPWFDALRTAPTPAEAIRIWVENTLPIYARVAPLAGMFLAEPAVAGIWEHSEQLRLDGFREVMELVLSSPVAASRLPLERATDVMFVLLGPLTYEEFVTRRGWPAAEWGAWVADVLAEALVGESSGT
jgi:AcrR family transcriptional regulator